MLWGTGADAAWEAASMFRGTFWGSLVRFRDPSVPVWPCTSRQAQESDVRRGALVRSCAASERKQATVGPSIQHTRAFACSN
jgi:hypothetical protein